MPTANEILNFNYSANALQQAADNSFHVSLIRLNELRINRLNKITEEVGETAFKFTGETLIPQVFKKFKSINTKGASLNEIFERRELRTLTYSLNHSEQSRQTIFSNAKELDILFEILETSWRDSYLIGLMDCYLKNWESKNHTTSSQKLGKFIFGKLGQYEGGRAVLKSLKANIKFFDGKNGDVVLGSEIAIKNKNIKEATKYLSLPDSWFSYPYFTHVILTYFEKKKNDMDKILDELTIALEVHSNSTKGTKANKILVSQIIIQCNKQEFAFLQDKVKRMAFNLVGDPGNASSWTAFEDATENDKEELKKGRSILNEWITREFINVFFERCINDARRKRFWLQYANKITQFRVVGSKYIYSLLWNDTRIREYVQPRFSNTHSIRDRNAALMFIMGNHLFIEFSDEGAFYAYKLLNPNAPSIESPHFYSTSNLKTPSMNWLVYRTGNTVDRIYDEGRLGHNDGGLDWESIASYWITSKAGINV